MRGRTALRGRRARSAVAVLVAAGLAVSCRGGADDDEAATEGASTETSPAEREEALDEIGDAMAESPVEATTTIASPTDGDSSGAVPAPAPSTPPPPPVPPERDGGGVALPPLVVNPFLDPAVDPLSTFAVDVDTGSYTLTRSSLGLDRLPAPELVRPEEFVNYFDQGYERPDGDGFRVSVDGAPTPFTVGDNRLLRVGLSTRQPAPEERPDVALTLVVDVSGSMADGNKLELARQSLRLLVDQLRPTDTVAIVTYSTTARTVLEATPVADRAVITGILDGLRTLDSTNVEAGLVEGYRVAREGFADGALNRLVLVSDGVANVGATTPEAILGQVRGEAANGVGLVALGVGFGDYNDPLLEQLADDGDGFYAYVDDIGEAERLFVDQLAATLQPVAEDAKVQVRFDEIAVERYRLVGFENRAVADEDFTDDGVDAGEVGAGHTVTALYEVELAPLAGGSLGQVSVRWADAATGEVRALDEPIGKDAVSDSFDGASPRFQVDAVAAAFAEVLRGSEHVAGTSIGEVAAAADEVALRNPGDADVAELAALATKAAALAG